jgi:hypothetical protein
MRHEVHTPPPHADVGGELSDAELEDVRAGKALVAARAVLPLQWGGRSAAAVRPAPAPVPAVTTSGGCVGGVCRPR